MKFFQKNTPFCHDFKSRVTIFKRIFLRPQESKWKSFSAHQQENYMQIPKLTLLLFLVPFLWELWPFKHGPAFFGTPCMYINISRFNHDWDGSEWSWPSLAPEARNSWVAETAEGAGHHISECGPGGGRGVLDRQGGQTEEPPEDVYILGQALVTAKQYHRAATTMINNLHKWQVHVGCCYVTAKVEFRYYGL